MKDVCELSVGGVKSDIANISFHIFRTVLNFCELEQHVGMM